MTSRLRIAIFPNNHRLSELFAGAIDMTSTNEFPNNGGYFGYKSTTINPETIENSISNYDDCFKNKSVKPIDDQRHYSFDVFDTAVCRLVHSPEHIHLVVGRKLRNRGHTNYSDAEWMYIRAQSEFRSRSKFDHNEVTISDIYGVMSTLIGWSAERARIAIDLELEEELRLVKPIIGIKLLIETHIKQSKNVFLLLIHIFNLILSHHCFRRRDTDLHLM
ncbi:hypothetical protein FV228_23020 [Methylobacterium sp. WL18]|uniref:hypothetical protein n=1 Tax=Methylobacterium sp. WL18 TaxID=2603897 RepID=UPI0011C77708|nr:hypothetical protein [Methylobacterium sp. WL18]TXN60509.1 hypothetical protein FV228_23020 [Methylobacterium sp. WL18]